MNNIRDTLRIGSESIFKWIISELIIFLLSIS